VGASHHDSRLFSLGLPRKVVMRSATSFKGALDAGDPAHPVFSSEETLATFRAAPKAQATPTILVKPLDMSRAARQLTGLCRWRSMVGRIDPLADPSSPTRSFRRVRPLWQGDGERLGRPDGGRRVGHHELRTGRGRPPTSPLSTTDHGMRSWTPRRSGVFAVPGRGPSTRHPVCVRRLESRRDRVGHLDLAFRVRVDVRPENAVSDDDSAALVCLGVAAAHHRDGTADPDIFRSCTHSGSRSGGWSRAGLGAAPVYPRPTCRSSRRRVLRAASRAPSPEEIEQTRLRENERGWPAMVAVHDEARARARWPRAPSAMSHFLVAAGRSSSRSKANGRRWRRELESLARRFKQSATFVRTRSSCAARDHHNK